MSSTPKRYGLLIAIDCYLPNKLPDNSYYPNLRGCVRDVSHVQAFLKFPPGQLVQLTATNTGAVEPPEPRKHWPTYENIVAAFKQVTGMAQAGDHVYIHYSGHGGRARTIYPERKGPHGVDEALVPTDIGNSEARYLRDLELAKLLSDMEAKGLVVVVVLDSCHSGGMTRGGGDVGIRGIGTVDDTPRPKQSLVGTADELIQVWDTVTAGGTRKVSLGAGWLPEPKGYTMLAACRPSESAFEYPFDGKERNGALTYWLLDSLADAGPGLSYKQLHDRIVAKVHCQFENQTPQLQGEGDRVFFGSERVQPHYAAPVMRVDVPGKRLLIGAGQAHGLKAGARFTIYPHGADVARPDLRLAVAEISELGAVDSWANILDVPKPQPVQQGAQAVLSGSGSVRLVQKLWLQLQNDLPSALNQVAALDAVAAALIHSGWIEKAAAGEPIDYNLAVNAQGEYEIWDRAGHPIHNLRPPIKVTAPDAVASVARRLVHLAKYNAIKQLANHDPLSPLTRKLVVELAGKRKVFDPADPFEPEEQFTEAGHTPTVIVGEWIGLRIKNTAGQKLNVTLFDLQPDWAVSQVYPSGVGDYFVEFEPGEEKVLPLRADLPADYKEGNDLLKVLATLATTNFRWLELPVLDQPLERALTRSGEVPANPLESLLAAFSANQPPTRALIPAASPSHGWVTAQVELRLKRP